VSDVIERIGASPAHTEMLRRHGRRLAAGTCERCAHLRATAGPRPEDRQHRPLTTFACDRDGSGTPWSVLAPACGAFEVVE